MAKTLLIFGGGFLQLSLIERCQVQGYKSVVIDPFDGAPGKNLADHFEVIGGQDFEGTCAMVEKYQIDGILTSATDKPLVMMARIATHFQLPFFSVQTAKICTDKQQMKATFLANKIPCAHGYLIEKPKDIEKYPVIIKPLDNSGSRGVYFCENEIAAQTLIPSAFQHTKNNQLLAETFIEGSEYSVESIHFGRTSKVVQITEKITTEFPTNVEIGHIAPAKITEEMVEKVEQLIERIHLAFDFDHCAAHTEIKIQNGAITVIETSPRLGGDFISSDLVPLSTGVNMEDALIAIALGETPELAAKEMHVAGAFFFLFESGKRIKKIPTLEVLNSMESLKKIDITLKANEIVSFVESSLDRHGHFVLQASNRETLERDRRKIQQEVHAQIEYFESA
ncbi:MAG: ATP-grasp domain-containing protein [Crocinitomicaceae bacterium]